MILKILKLKLWEEKFNKFCKNQLKEYTFDEFDEDLRKNPWKLFAITMFLAGCSSIDLKELKKFMKWK